MARLLQIFTKCNYFVRPRKSAAKYHTKGEIYSSGTPYSAITHLRKIVEIAKINLKLIDPYSDMKAVYLIENCNLGVNIQILSTRKPNFRGIESLLLEARAYKAQYGHMEVKLEKSPGTWHDRFIIIDDDQVYHLGASIKDIGKSATMIKELQNPHGVIDRFNTTWDNALQEV